MFWMAGLGFARPWTLGARASWWGLLGPLGLLVRPVLRALSALLAPRAPLARKGLLVRVTGYNAYFASIGRELQNEIIARESHNTW